MTTIDSLHQSTILKCIFICFAVSTFLACASTGSTPAVAPTAVALSESSKLEITSEAIDELSRSSDVSSDEIQKLGLKPDKYSKEEADLLMKRLESEDELMVVDITRAIQREVRTNELGEKEMSAEQFASIFQTLISDREVQALVAELQPGTIPDGQSQIAAMQRLSIRLDQLEKAATRRLSLRRKCRAWLGETLKDYRFNPSVALTIDVANPESRAVVVTDIAYVSLPGVRSRAFLLRNRTCNEEASACRLLFSYDLTNDEVKRLKTMLKIDPKTDLAVDTVQKELRRHLNKSDVDVELFLDREVVNISMPGKFVKLDSGG